MAVLMACGPAPAPSEPGDVVSPAPQAARGSSAGPSAPVTPHQLDPPGSYDALQTMAQEVGCRLISEDAKTVACLQSELEMGFVHATLAVRSAHEATSASVTTIYDGPSQLEPERLKEGIAEANKVLQEGGYTLAGRPMAAQRKAMTRDGKLFVSVVEKEAQAALPPLASNAPTTGLEAHVQTCCRWAVEDAAFFDAIERVMVRLRRDCDFGSPAAQRDGVPPACFDPEYNEENDPIVFSYQTVAY